MDTAALVTENTELRANIQNMVQKEKVLEAIDDIVSKYSELLDVYKSTSNELGRCNSEYNLQLDEVNTLSEQYEKDLDKFKSKCLSCVDSATDEKNKVQVNSKKALYLYSIVQKDKAIINFLIVICSIVLVLIVLRFFGKI